MPKRSEEEHNYSSDISIENSQVPPVSLGTSSKYSSSSGRVAATFAYSPATSRPCTSLMSEPKRRKDKDNPRSEEMANSSPSKTDEASTLHAPLDKVSGFDSNLQNFDKIVHFESFVDRSLLLKELLYSSDSQLSKQVMIFAPTKFGKSVNMNMCRLFFSIEHEDGVSKRGDLMNPTEKELDASYVMQVFRRFSKEESEWCKILKEKDFVKEHFGTHPVVFLDFKEFNAETKDDAIYQFALLIRQAYSDHKYLRSSKAFDVDDPFLNNLKESCQTWCSYTEGSIEECKLSSTKVKLGLKNLIESLKVHWQRYPMLLVDEIDKPVIKAVQNKIAEDTIKLIGTVVSDMLCGILKTTVTDTQLAGALITGISYLCNMGLSGLSNTTPAYFLRDARFSKYYGLTHNEVVELVNRLVDVSDTDTALKFIQQYYNGYNEKNISRLKDSKQESNEYARYCLFSVLLCINGKGWIKGSGCLFWSEGGFLRTVFRLLRDSVLLGTISSLMCNETIPINYEVHGLDGSRLLGIYDEQQHIFRGTILNFLLQRGYLTEDPKKVQETNKVYVRIPNCEVLEEYRSMFEDYIDNSNMTETFLACGKFLSNLPAIMDQERFLEDLNTFQENLKSIFLFLTCQNEHSVSTYIELLGKIYGNYEEVIPQFKVQVEYNATTRKPTYVYIDVWMRKGDFAIIWELRVNLKSKNGSVGSKENTSLAAAEDILELMPKKREPESKHGKGGSGHDTKALDRNEIKKYLLVGLSVTGDHNVHMLVFKNSKDWKNVIPINPEASVTELLNKYLPKQ